MPAQVPPGYTRGPILFLGETTTRIEAATQLQRFWTDAGGYGARVLLLSATTNEELHNQYRQQFVEWGVAEMTVLPIYARRQALNVEHLPLIDNATGILLIDGDPAQLARRFGGTAVAQAIRRANAQGKTVAAIGNSANLLCQHMLIEASPQTFNFAPGLGLVNRITLHWRPTMSAAEAGPQLLAAIAYNPFLVGVHLTYNTSVAIYPDATMEVIGAKPILLLDGAASVCDDFATNTITDLSETGVKYHLLAPGDTFNFDQRTVARPQPSDMPMIVKPEANTTSF